MGQEASKQPSEAPCGRQTSGITTHASLYQTLVESVVEPQPAESEQTAKSVRCYSTPKVLLLSEIKVKPTTRACKASASAPAHNCVLDAHIIDTAEASHVSPVAPSVAGEESVTSVNQHEPTQESEEAFGARVKQAPETPFLQFLPSLPQITQACEMQFHGGMGDENLIQVNSSPNTREQTNTSFPIAVACPPDTYVRGNSDEATRNGSPASVILPEPLEFSPDASTSTPSGSACAQMKELPGISHLSDVHVRTHGSTTRKFEGCCSTSSIVGRLELLSLQDGETHEQGQRIDSDLTRPIEDEILIPVATTYADATNLATKYPDLASKILVLPLQASPSDHRSTALTPSLEGSDQTMPRADNVGPTQNREPSESRSEVSQCRGNVTNDWSQGKVVISTGKLRAWSSHLDEDVKSASDTRAILSRSGAINAEKMTGSMNRHTDRIGQKFKGAITSESPTPTRKDLHLQNSRGDGKSSSRGQKIRRRADEPRRPSRRSLEPPRDWGGTGESTRKRTASARVPSDRNTNATLQMATTTREPKSVVERRSSMKQKYATQRRTEADQDNATRDHPVALRAFDCMLGSHVLHGDNLTLTVGPISVLGEDIQRQSTSVTVHGSHRPAHRETPPPKHSGSVSRFVPTALRAEKLATGNKMLRLPGSTVNFDQCLDVGGTSTSRRRVSTQLIHGYTTTLQ